MRKFSFIKGFATIGVIIFFILTACKKKSCVDVDGNLTAAEMSWLSYGSGGQTLIFKYDTLLDTFYVHNKNIGYSAGYVEEEDPCEHHQQFQSYLIEDSTSINFFLGVGHNNQWVHGGASISDKAGGFSLSDCTPQNNILINGNTYNSVYIVTRDSANLANEDPFRMYYTKANGVLEIDQLGGKHWVKIN